VVFIPRSGARLAETAAHLFLVLRDAARVDSPIGGSVGLDTAVIGAAVFLLRFLWRLPLRLRRFVSLLPGLLLRRLLPLLLRRLLMLLRRSLLMLWLCGLRLLMLLRRLRFAMLLTLLLALGVARDSDSEKQEHNCCADEASSFHLSMLLLSARSVDPEFFFIMQVRCDLGSV
jgi:hypothetical protein